MVRREQIEEIDLPGIEGMVGALWSSHRCTDEEALIIFCDIDVLCALGRVAEFAQRACPVVFRLPVGELHQALLWNMIAMGAAITIHTDSCHRSRIAQLGFPNSHSISLLPTYKRSNVFNHCTAEASLYERAPADRTTSNTVITPTPANAASARLCQSKSPPSVTMLASERTTNDEQHSIIWPNSARSAHTSIGTSMIRPDPTAIIPAPTTAPDADPKADCPTR